MATVYKIEVKATSHWINFPPDEIEKRIKAAIEDEFIDDSTHSKSRNEFNVTEINVERTA
jgi:hypothetical protein